MEINFNSNAILFTPRQSLEDVPDSHQKTESRRHNLNLLPTSPGKEWLAIEDINSPEWNGDSNPVQASSGNFRNIIFGLISGIGELKHIIQYVVLTMKVL